jgi:hypothetical protein
MNRNLNYLALLATIGSFFVSVLVMVMPAPNSQQGCPYRGDNDPKPMERPAPRSDNEAPALQRGDKGTKPLPRGDRLDRPSGETGVPIMTQEPYPFAWRHTAKEICMAVIVACALGIFIIRLMR